MGVFLKLAGKSPEKTKFLGKHYPRYGHAQEQKKEAFHFGLLLGECLRKKRSIENLNFQTTVTGCGKK